MSLKCCVICKVFKLIDDFAEHEAVKHYGACKACVAMEDERFKKELRLDKRMLVEGNERSRGLYQKYKETKLAYNARWREANRERIAEAAKAERLRKKKA